MTLKPTPTDLRVRTAHHGPSGDGTPYISDGDTARVLCFMNLSGAYGGFAGADQARQDALAMAAGPKLLALMKRMLDNPSYGQRPEFEDAAEEARALIDQIAAATGSSR